MKKVFDRDILKYIAIVAMLFDHIAWVFLSFDTAAAQIFHTFGRLTAPIMCFFIAQGYMHTRNYKKYALRLLVFALISQFPWWIMHGELFTVSFNMIFTLFFCLIAVHVQNTVDDKAEKAIIVFALCACTIVCDWYVFAVMWCIGFSKYANNIKKMMLWFSAVNVAYFAFTFIQNLNGSAPNAAHALISSLYTLGTFIAVPLILSYNGEKGKFAASKWIFYVFYPLHMLVLGVIKYSLA